MKRIVIKYRMSKYKRFTEGLIFAIIATIALALCITGISAGVAQKDIILPFLIAILSMLMGLISMFRRIERPGKLLKEPGRFAESAKSIQRTEKAA